jgi:hypothetical protein
MTKIKEILGLGLIYQNSSKVQYRITKNSEIDILIPMIEDGLKGAKALAFRDFVQIQDMINNGLHRTEDGLQNISKIKLSMNKYQNDEK